MGGSICANAIAVRNRWNRSAWSGHTHASSQRERVRIGDVDRRPVETDPGADDGVSGGHRDITARAALEHYLRWRADRSTRFVAALVAIEEQREPSAAADVDEGERAGLAGDEAEQRQDRCATTDLVGLRRSGGEQTGEPLFVLGAELAKGWIRRGRVDFGREVRVVAGKRLIGLVQEQPMHARKQQNGKLLLLGSVQQQA